MCIRDSFWAADSIAADAGIDWLRSHVSLRLPDAVANLTLLGADERNGDGHDGANVLDGNAAANILVGFGGNDSILGQGGADFLAGGTGDDTIWGDDTAGLAAGDDTAWGGQGNDRMAGGAGLDLLNGDRGADSIQGGGGAATPSAQIVIDTSPDGATVIVDGSWLGAAAIGAATRSRVPSQRSEATDRTVNISPATRYVSTSGSRFVTLSTTLVVSINGR